MARSSKMDPLNKYRWTVSISGFSKLGFQETSTPGYSITPKKYKEGGAHLTPRQIVNTVDYTPVTLTRGVTNDTSFNKWATSMFDLVTNSAAFNNSAGKDEKWKTKALGAASAALNNGTAPIPSPVVSGAKDYRRDVRIEHVGRTGQVEVVYVLYAAYPIAYKPASDFGAMSDDGVSIESITLAYDSFEVIYSGLAGAAANLLS